MPLIDLHCDTILGLMKDKDSLELRKNDFSVDIEKLQQAKSMAQFFALFIYLQPDKDPLEQCLEMADKFYIELAKNKDAIRLARNYDEMMQNYNNGKISAFLTIEEGGAIKGKMHHLRNFYRLGVRLITLTWNFPNEIGHPNYKYEYKDKGLTAFGEEVVHEMNELGMIIDVSHLSDQGFYDVARFTKKPFVASHSNAREITAHSRNLTDDMIHILADKGGVTGINFERSFLGNSEVGKIDEMVQHIKYLYKTGGIDIISIGSDFDGINPCPEIQHIGEMDKLSSALQKQGFSEDEIDKIFYKNALRVIKETMK